MSEILRKKLGNNIRYARKRLSFSQEKVAELIGKSRNYVGMVERGELNTPVSVIFDFAKALRIEPKNLFDF